MKAEYYTTIFQLIPDSLPESFYIVTAWNPLGQTITTTENHVRDAQLESELQNRKPFRVIGMSPDEKHGEPGWDFIATEEEALAFAIKYEQDAIYHVGENQLTLISTDGKDSIFISDLVVALGGGFTGIGCGGHVGEAWVHRHLRSS